MVSTYMMKLLDKHDTHELFIGCNKDQNIVHDTLHLTFSWSDRYCRQDVGFLKVRKLLHMLFHIMNYNSSSFQTNDKKDSHKQLHVLVKFLNE